VPELAIQSEHAPGVGRLRRGTARIASVGMAVPDRVVANAEIAERLGVGQGWIEKRTGVRERRIARPDERLVDLASTAATAALERADVGAAELDLVLVATMSSDELTPNVAPLVASELGAGPAGAIDVGAACTGFVSALALATAQVEAERVENVLVIGADLLSRITNPDDRATAGLLADGAGAALIRPTRGRGGFGPFVLGSDGRHADLITAGRSEGVIHMNGHDTFRHAVARMSQATLDVLARAGLELSDVDLFVYHQANSRILKAVGEELGLPGERVPDYLPRFANTSAATLPMALALAEEEGRLGDGSLVLLAAFGAGLTWGAALCEWGSDDA
jgi:3-oxoacyl-[acyl-carrier-protein] synthase-3